VRNEEYDIEGKCTLLRPEVNIFSERSVTEFHSHLPHIKAYGLVYIIHDNIRH
jgi:hypothetical protein